MPAEQPVPHPWVEIPDDVAVADTAIMQSLAHPLRLRLLGLLRTQGPSTATKLAAQSGESSGLTSYHLRQLASAGLVTEATAEDLAGVRQTGGRERWWKSAHRYTMVRNSVGDDDADRIAALDDYSQAVVASLSGEVRRWLGVRHTWPAEWQRVGGFSDIELRLTPEETERLETDLMAVIGRYRQHQPGAEHPAGTVIVSTQFQVFPYPDQEPPAD
jgi:DNA-binding transcriptional ArsR family regulator